MYAFISYQTADRLVAEKIKILLQSVGIGSFLAHNDVNVSEEWRLKILEEIGAADVFVSLWSQNYYGSYWCIQESGIASFRKGLTVIPLSIDGSTPQGFANNIQSTQIDPTNVQLSDLLPGLVKVEPDLGIKLTFKNIKGSRSFRGAEANFNQIIPHLDILTPEQAKELLQISIGNNQVHHAGLCASEYLPPIFAKYGHLLAPNDRQFLYGILEDYTT